MSDNPLDTILPKLQNTHTKMLAYLATLDDATANRKLQSDHGEHWSPREIVGHLTDAERAHRRFIEAVAGGNPPAKIEGFDLDAWNAGRVAKRAGQPLGELIAAFEAERAATLALLATLPADAWPQRGYHAALGDKSVEEVARIIGLHERMHLQEMIGG